MANIVVDGTDTKNGIDILYEEVGFYAKANKYELVEGTTYPVDLVLDSVYHDSEDDDKYEYTAVGIYAFNKCEVLRSVKMPYICTIEEGAFQDCINLETVILPTSLESIGEYAFGLFTHEEGDATHLNIFYEGTSTQWDQVSRDPWAFIDRTISYYFYSETQPTKTGNYWHYNENGEPVIWSKYKAELAYTLLNNGTYEVSGIGNVTDTDIIIPSTYNNKAVTSVGYRAFFNCVNLTSVRISNNVTNIGESAFQGCEKLVYIKIPDGVTLIGVGAFRGCVGLKTIDIPNSVVDIGQNAFYNCTNLAKVSLSKNMTTINMQTFYRCEALTEITIPASITSIDSKACYRCDSLTKISLLGEEPPTLVDSNAFYIRDENKVDHPTTATFYCDSPLVDVYKTATNWQVFANQFKTFDKDDYLKFYFVRNANAQKKYFASKKELADLEGRIDSNYVNTTSNQEDIEGSKTFKRSITASGFYATSDARKKENIVDYTPEKSILDLPVKEFNFIGQEDKQIGCIAQDLQQLFPNLVKKGSDGYLSIQEDKLVYLLLFEVKVLKEEINKLKGV